MISFENETINPTIFPDKTSQVWKLSKEKLTKIAVELDEIVIKWDFENEAELIHVCQLATLFNSLFPRKKLILHVPYMPYGRQDKHPTNGSTFALHTFCEIIEIYFDHVITFDVHNALFFAHHDGECRYEFTMTNILPDSLIQDFINRNNINVLLYPDQSASERYHLDAELILVADKHRVPETGHIDKLIVPNPARVAGKRVLVVDDLCDGGFTHCLAAAAVKPYGPEYLGLYTSHGLYSKGKKILHDAGYVDLLNRHNIQ